MKKILKIVGASCLAIVMALSLTGCDSTTTTSSSNQLVIWGFVDKDVFSPIIKDFQSQHKGITVKYYQKSLDNNYENDALNSILSGQGPDVWAIPNDWVYRHKDKLAPMPANLLTDKKIVAKDYFADAVMKDNAFDNQIYGLTPTIDILQVYFNPALFDNARSHVNKTLSESNHDAQQELNKILSNFPITWDEFNKIIPYLTVKNGSSISVAGAALGTSSNVSYSQDILSLLMLQNQTKMTSDDLSQANFNLPVKNTAGADVYPGRNALDFYSGFSNSGSGIYTWNAGMPSDVEAFVKNQAAIIFGYSNLSTFFHQIYPNFQFQQALMPQVGDINNIVDYAHYTSYVVPTASPNTALAWQFVVSLSTDEASTYRSTTKEIPAKKADSEISLKNRGGATPSQNQIKTAVSWNKGRYPLGVDSQLRQAIDRINSGAQSSQTSLDTAASNITDLLRKTIW